MHGRQYLAKLIIADQAGFTVRRTLDCRLFDRL
jgi:hypothetical protein